MRFSDLLPEIEPGMQGAFVQFVETGKAPEEFLAYLDSDARCQHAMMRVLAWQREAIESRTRAPHASLAGRTLAAAVSWNLTHAILQALTLPAHERVQVLQATASDLRTALPGAGADTDALCAALAALGTTTVESHPREAATSEMRRATSRAL